jgi:hypothetical protein
MRNSGEVPFFSRLVRGIINKRFVVGRMAAG